MADGPRSGACDEVGESFRMSKLTLRFLNPIEEEAFKRGRKQRMLGNLSALLLCMSAIVLPSFAVRLLVASEGAGMDIAQQSLVGTLGLAVIAGPVLAVLMRVPRFQEFLRFEACEILVVALMVAIAARETMHMRIEYLALGLDAIVTAVHIALPIRWYVVVWIDVLFVIGYTVRVALHFSVYQDFAVLYIVSCFAGLVFASNLGLRSMELTDRSLFATVVDERSLRARAEFSLEQVVQHDQAGARSAIEASSKEGTSLHQGSTRSNTTELLFQRMGEDSGVVSTVLHALGEQEDWLVEQDRLEIFPTQVLGRGGFGLVVSGLYYSAPVAVKLFASKGNASNEHDAVMNELRVLRRLKHPNIVIFYGASLYTSPLDERVDVRLVFERVAGKTLSNFATRMQGGRGLPLNGRQITSCLCIMRDVTRALIYLHDRSPPIVHSDLKPSNIMVQRPWPAPTAKLLDFGISRVVSRRSMIIGGTSGFRAPETQKGSTLQASPPADMFAVGRILLYLASGTVRKAETCATLPEEWRDTVDACTRAEPSERPTATQLYRAMFEEGAAHASQSTSGLASPMAVSEEDDGLPSERAWFQTTDPLEHKPLRAIREGLSL